MVSRNTRNKRTQVQHFWPALFLLCSLCSPPSQNETVFSRNVICNYSKTVKWFVKFGHNTCKQSTSLTKINTASIPKILSCSIKIVTFSLLNYFTKIVNWRMQCLYTHILLLSYEFETMLCPKGWRNCIFSPVS